MDLVKPAALFFLRRVRGCRRVPPVELIGLIIVVVIIVHDSGRVNARYRPQTTARLGLFVAVVTAVIAAITAIVDATTAVVGVFVVGVFVVGVTKT